MNLISGGSAQAEENATVSAAHYFEVGDITIEVT